MRSTTFIPNIHLSTREVPAADALRLPAIQRRALILAITAGPLTGHRRFANAACQHEPFDHRTINAIRRRGLMTVTGCRSKHRASLTPTGRWYARTLCSAIDGARLQTTKGVAACPIEN